MKKLQDNTGQALVTLLIFVFITTIVTSAAIVLIVTNSLSVGSVQSGTNAYIVAESGIENALIRMLRDPDYTGETMTMDAGTATITITGTEPRTITSRGSSGDFTRTIEVVVGYTNNIMTISSWKEIY